MVDVIGTSDNCKDTFVYVADALGFGILVVDVANDRSWRVTHRFMYPYPSHGSFKINGEFNLIDNNLAYLPVDMICFVEIDKTN